MDSGCLKKGKGSKQILIRKTLNLWTCADSSTDTTQIPKQTETDKNAQRWTETDINKRKPNKTDRNGQKRTETDRNGQKQTETDRNRQKQTDMEDCGICKKIFYNEEELKKHEDERTRLCGMC